MEQLKLLQRNQSIPDLSLLYQNPSLFYTANPFWWHQLIFSLPPVFNNNNNSNSNNNNSLKDESRAESPKREYILTPETPEREDNYDMDMDEPLNLSKKDILRETDISSSFSLPPTPKLNSNLFSAIWSPASLVSQNIKCESSENSPTTPNLKFNFDNLRGIKRESSAPSVDYEMLKKNCTEMFLNNNNNSNNNNNNNLSFNNLNSSFSGSDSSNLLDKVPKFSRKSLPIIKPDSTEHSEYFVREFRDEKGKKERSFEVSIYLK
jgi:hypothetical protein